MKGDHIGELEELVLLAVHGLGADAYGVSVQLLLERETDRDVSIGAVYSALDRLEAKGLLRSEPVAGTPVRGGRGRRGFQLTPAGARTLESLRRVRERLYGAARTRAAKGRA
jgi:DNA-binding PadR family transcriptional regulator